MNLAISNIAWDAKDDSRVFNKLRKYDISRLEVAPARVVENINSYSSSEVLKYKDYISSFNLEVVSMQALLYGGPGGNIFSRDESQLISKHLLKVIEMASMLGASKLVFGSPKNRLKGQLSSEQAFESAASFFEPLAVKAAEYGAEICIENNPAYYGADFLTTAQDVVDFVKYCSFKGLGAHFDTGGMFLSGEDYNEVIDMNGEFISHFHVSEKDLLAISEDNIPHEKIANTLRDIAYQNIVSLEMKNANDDLKSLDNSLDIFTRIYR